MLLAEFESAEDLVRAATALHLLGHGDLETYSPHAIPELVERGPRPRLPWFAGLALVATLPFACEGHPYVT